MKMYSRPQTKYPLVAKAMVVCKTWVAASKTAGVGSNPTAPAKIIIQKVRSNNCHRARNFAAPIFVYLTFSKQCVIINI